MAHPAPVASVERIETLDVLRGFALLGILAMNIRAMAAPFGAYMYPYALFDYTGVSRAAYLFNERRLRSEDDGAVFDALRRRRAALCGEADGIGQCAACALVQADVLAADH